MTTMQTLGWLMIVGGLLVFLYDALKTIRRP